MSFASRDNESDAGGVTCAWSTGWIATRALRFTRAPEVQRHALNAGFHRARSLPDLLIAATAELNRLTVLHYDGDFDVIASLTCRPTEWVVPPGAADR